MPIIVDASAYLDVLLRTSKAVVIGTRMFKNREQLLAPVTIDAEMVHALRRQWVAGLISDESARGALRDFASLRIERHPVEPLVARMWMLRRNVTAYDAAYVALAEQLDVPLITRPAALPLQRTRRSHRVHRLTD